ncbi:MAG TPA: oligopeptide/dipeptide ABC transporter ATP-binding protein [Longimicrobiales bacterium]|nr:oligopeptide/dipeptide ABC transporter ATP-binding protein [Longimicrobiales bacterium]
MRGRGEVLLSVRDLEKRYQPRGRGGRGGPPTRAVDGVSFDVHRGETLGLVGESGSGKTTLGRAVLRLVEPDGGSVHFDGIDVRALDAPDLRAFRRRVQIVFQDPWGSLNPRMRVRTALREVLAAHGVAAGRVARSRRVDELLERVGLSAEHGGRLPHELSGGERQRVGIARALAVEPELLVLDEPVSALDVSVRAQVVNLLTELQSALGLTYLFIAHDLSLVEHVSDRVAVMYLGRIVEIGSARALYSEPKHPYTRALLSAAMTTGLHVRPGVGRPVLRGDPPDPRHPPPGCPFHPRCPHPDRDETCARVVPALTPKAPGQLAACIKEPELGSDSGPGGSGGRGSEPPESPSASGPGPSRSRNEADTRAYREARNQRESGG